ncbi:NADP-dependent L-serine/L-allo-threonine dehydrogenase ydfG [Apiospora sp. TS-2023a]
MALSGKVVMLTGASMGIGEAIAHALAAEGARLILISRSKDKLEKLLQALSDKHADFQGSFYATDVSDHKAVEESVSQAVKAAGRIDILINNAGLALGAPARFPDLSISDMVTMNNTNVNGYMFTAHAVLNQAMLSRDDNGGTGGGGEGTILNITSTTALEAPPFPGEAVYHANKALQEAFTNALRNELAGTDIRVLALRPGVVATHFHEQRVGFDRGMYEEFMQGFQPLLAEDVASAAVFMLSQPLNRSIKALDVAERIGQADKFQAQRSLNVFDRNWNERNPQRGI